MTDRRKQAIALGEMDAVANVLEEVRKGDTVLIKRGDHEIEIQAKCDIPKFHKVALAAYSKGQPVVRGGYVIGVATIDIAAASWVHTHNLSSNRASQPHAKSVDQEVPSQATKLT